MIKKSILSLGLALSACQVSDAGVLRDAVLKCAPEDQCSTVKHSADIENDLRPLDENSLILPDDIKEKVPPEMQYSVFLQLVCNLIRNEYVRDISEGCLTEKAIAGILSSLDIHSSYLNEKAFAALRSQTEGEFGGIGIEMMVDDGMIRVISTLDDTPAYHAGLKSGDIIVYIEDECINGITAEEAVAKLRGKPSTKVKLKIKRGTGVPFDVNIERKIIKVQSVKGEVLNGVGYIRISTFDANTSKDVKKFIKAHTGLSGIVLDVRNNPGGLLSEAVAVANIFLKGGKIVSTKGRAPDSSQEFFADDVDLTDGLPLVVLINSGTASAPEILAGALRDNKRAIIVGVRSFGKGSVQKVIPLSEKTAIRLTVAKHYTPSGECIQANGISPDIEADYAVISRPEAQFVIREEFFNNALDVSSKSKYKKNTDAKNKQALDDLAKKQHDKSGNKDEDYELLYRKLSLKERAEKDYQLSKAFDTIKAIVHFRNMGITNEKK